MFLAVAAGGALGAAGRHAVNGAVLRVLGPDPALPLATLSVNIAGALLAGMITEALALRLNASLEVRAFLVTGVLGGFTTFSAFSLELSLMLVRRDYLLSLGYGSVSVAGGVLAFFAGLWAVRSLWGAP